MCILPTNSETNHGEPIPDDPPQDPSLNQLHQPDPSVNQQDPSFNQQDTSFNQHNLSLNQQDVSLNQQDSGFLETREQTSADNSISNSSSLSLGTNWSSSGCSFLSQTSPISFPSVALDSFAACDDESVQPLKLFKIEVTETCRGARTKRHHDGDLFGRNKQKSPEANSINIDDQVQSLVTSFARLSANRKNRKRFNSTGAIGTATFGTATSTGGSVFGQPAQPQQTTSLFGGGSTAFGGQQNALPAFGSGATTGVTATGAFGAQANTSSVFGQQARPATGIFSTTTNTISPFSTQTQVAGTSIPFNAITGTDTMMKNGAASQINTRHQCITCMKEYENKSLEELRLEDYQLNRKGPQTSMFGAAAGATQTQPGTGLFSGIGGGAGATAPGTSTFGQTSAFGQTAGTTGGGLFSSLNQPKPGGFFGSGATPTSTAFGGGSALGFSFNNTSAQPQTSIFGSNNNPATSNTGLGTPSAFSFSSQPQQQQQGLSLFGQKPLTTPASSAPTFGGGFGTTAANTTLNKPLFGGGTTTTFGTGTAAPTFGTGTGSLFSNNTQQQQQQNKPFTFSTPFSSTAQPNSQPTFGATSSTSTFSFSNPVSTPAVNFGSGSAPTFGATGTTTGTGSTFCAPISFSMGNTAQQQQPGGGTGSTFGSGFFSSGTNNPSATGGTGTGLSLFGSNPGTSTLGTSFGAGLQLQTPQQQLQMQQQQQQQQFMMQGTISFATTPFKDNELFYNLISNRKVEDMSRPTNPLAQRRYREASRRKTSTSAGPSSIGTLNISASPAVKSLTYPSNSRSSSITKFQIFDGFQDEDFGIGVDVLSPKTNVKKLVLKTIDSNTSTPSSTPTNGANEVVGLARRASMLAGGVQSNKSNCQSPLLQQRRVRLTLNSSLNNSYTGPDNSTAGIAADSNRTLDLGDTSIISNDGHLLSNNTHNHSGGSDVGGGDAFIPAGFASKRGSEAEFGVGSFINGSGSPSGGGAAITDSNAGNICGVICTRPGYYVKPSLEELDKKVDPNGNCIVRGFEVGRESFGRIRFLEPVNLANINLDEIVLFRHKEVVVYPDDDNKPELGKGLNVPAEIELERVWPIDKASNELVRAPDKIRALNYEQKLRKACDRLGAEFVAYDELQGLWKFNVSHFSKYSCELEEEEEATSQQQQQPPKGGLGGMPQQKMQPQPKTGMLLQGSLPQPGPGGDAPTLMPSARMSLPTHLTGLKSPPAPMRVIAAPTLDMMDSGSQPVSDVELNPLTPCDSDDDDDEDLDDEEVDEDLDDNMVLSRRPPIGVAQLSQGASSSSKYKPVLKDCGTDKSKMMMSVMSMEEFDDEDPGLIYDSQPPVKKSKPGRVTFSTDVAPIMETESLKLKQRLQQPIGSLGRKGSIPENPVRPPPPAVVAQDVVEFSEEPAEDLFADIGSRTMTTPVKLQGCPRVCFLPNGHFLTVSQSMSKRGFKGQVKLSQLVSYADRQEMAPTSGPIRSVMEAQLRGRLEREGVLFQHHIQTLLQEIGDATPGQPSLLALQEELVIWELCDILWPEENADASFSEDNSFLLEQRKRLEEWFKNHTPILFGSVYDGKDNSVLGLLKKGCMEDACMKALDDGYPWLAAMLGSEPHLVLDFSENPEVLEGMPARFADVFSLVSGNLLQFSELNVDKIKSSNTYDWLQYFALFLWYKSPVKSELFIPVDQSVREYEEMMRGIANDAEGALPTTESSSIANLAMHLLKMHSCTGYPLHILLSPRTWSTDCLDYKLAWLLMREMEEIGYLPRDETYKNVCLSFSGMLEAIKMWKWAIFVLRHIPGPESPEEVEEGLERKVNSARKVFCQRIMERNLKDEKGDEENFLVDYLGIPEAVIYSIKSWRSETSRRNRSDETMWYKGNLGYWQEAFQVFKKYLQSTDAIDLIGNRVPILATNMKEHLKRLKANKAKIVGWEVHGKMLESYLALQDPSMIQDAMLDFLESGIKFVPSDVKQCAFLLDMALSAQKVIQLELLMSEIDETSVARGKINKSLVQFLRIPVPKEYFTGLSAFIDNNVVSARSRLIDATLPFEVEELMEPEEEENVLM